MAAEITLSSDSAERDQQLNLAHLTVGFLVLTAFIYCAATALHYLMLS
jgi:hypothetical protein